MGTAHHVSAPRTAAWLLGVASLLAACGPGGGNNVAGHTPSPVAPLSASASISPSSQPSASPSAQPVTGTYGVLYSSQAATSYTVSIVAVDGKVVASAEATTPPNPTCGSNAAALVNAPVSLSNSRAYFMDAQGAVHWLDPSGNRDQAPIATLPAPSTSRRSMFAVSPDDAEMAVVVDNFTASGASTQLFMYDLNTGGTQRSLFSESGSFTLWPVGWHGTSNLVVAKVPSCTQGGGPLCCGPLELHVVDPATGDRRFTLGGPGCVIAGTPSPVGAVCENSPTFSQATVLSWTNGTVRTFSIPGFEYGYLSPNGNHVALVGNDGTLFEPTGKTTPGMFACTWIDDAHVLSGGDAQHQPVITDAVGGAAAIPVPAQGECAGRLPGGL